MDQNKRVVVTGLLLAILAAPCAWSQEGAPTASGQPPAVPSAPRQKNAGSSQGTFQRVPLLGDFIRDQKAIVKSPLSLRLQDVVWLAPLGGLTAGLLMSDSTVSRHLNSSPTRIQHSHDVANYGVAALGAAGGGLYLLGKMRHDSRRSEAGWIVGEAMANAIVDAEALKYIFGRERPLEGDRDGSFRAGGASLPSGHAVLAWSAAAALAHEYPGPLTQLLAYGGAAAVSVARVTGKDHFPTDVLIASALGYFVGTRVWKTHHEADVDARYGEFVRGDESQRTAPSMGSPYVPVDSWVYDAFDRLSARGYLPGGFLGLRPWTRMECARLLGESEELIQGSEDEEPEAVRLQQALAAEFTAETARLGGGPNYGASVDSLYARWTGISGTPLNDGYDFAQTIVDDQGRPYRRGNNAITGFTSHAVAGPLAFYVQGEYQHAPGDPNPIERPGLIPRDNIGGTLPPPGPIAQVDRPRLLEAYVTLSAKGWQASFGRQALWWGPGASGGMMWSDNAEPVLMLRLTRTTPFTLPGVLRWLGAGRVEGVFGRLDGHHFVNAQEVGVIGTWQHTLANQPYVNAQKLMFKPTANFEFGVSESAIIGGPEFPITFGGLWRSLTSTGQLGHTRTTEPGDRRTGFDFRYRLPGLRKWLTLYNDSLAEDEVNPIAYPRRSAMNPGLYMPQVPGIPKLELRAEAAYTDLPGGLDPAFFYFNLRYLDGYTNNGNLLGNWIGRQGRALDFRGRYWVGPRRAIQFRYRKQGVDPAFLKGGTLHDFQTRADWMLHHDVGLSASVQYERWNFPLLASGSRSNVTSSIQVNWYPKWRLHRAP